MNKREAKNIETEAWHRVRMKRALRKLGCMFDGTETTAMLEEMVMIAFAPSVQQFDGVVTRAKEAME